MRCCGQNGGYEFLDCYSTLTKLMHITTLIKLFDSKHPYAEPEVWLVASMHVSTDLICHYYNHVRLLLTINSQQLKVWTVRRCTISAILFSAAMYMVVRSVESRGPITQTKIRQPLLRPFKFKPVKSRSLVIKMGTVEGRFQFKIGNDTSLQWLKSQVRA